MPHDLPPDVKAALVLLGVPIISLSVEKVGTRTITTTCVTTLDSGDTCEATSTITRPVFRVCRTADGETLCSTL